VSFVIVPAAMPQDLPEVLALFREYADGLETDLAFQGFAAELASLPGKYAPPQGRLLLARDGTGAAVGCVALRPIDGERCEMKRLFVRPAGRSSGLGRRLAARICDEARIAGYARICLDTLPTMASAIGLYRSLGFRPIDPYVFNPVPGTRFLGLDLRDGTREPSAAR
jgi:ribosomal protein S18 acetylase RimI-like enzyme